MTFKPRYLGTEEGKRVCRAYLAQLEAGRLQAELRRAADAAYDSHGAPDGHPDKFREAIEAVEALQARVYPADEEG